jgi:hypothetical protein
MPCIANQTVNFDGIMISDPNIIGIVILEIVLQLSKRVRGFGLPAVAKHGFLMWRWPPCASAAERRLKSRVFDWD